MAHAQKPDFVFRRNGRVHLNWRGASVQSTTGSRGVRISGSNAGYTMFRGSVKGTGYPPHSPVSPFTSPPVRHRVLSHFNWTLLRTLLLQYEYAYTWHTHCGITMAMKYHNSSTSISLLRQSGTLLFKQISNIGDINVRS